ncbi:MAG: MBL fold metallo-hydrolase [Pseudomonadota bacterium]
MLRGGTWQRVALRVRYGFLHHPTAGPTLIDTGYTEHALSAAGRGMALRLYSRLLSPRLNEAEQPARFLAHFGLTPEDITTIIVTHFHADHVSGLCLFPNARFIASDAAWDRISQRGAFANLRHGIFPELLPKDFAARLAPVEALPEKSHSSGLSGWDLFDDGSVLAVALPGHADGHMGLLFDDPSEPVFYATDTQWMLAALPKHARPRITARMIADAPKQLDASSDLVLEFQKAGGRVVLCHDPAPSPFDHDVETHLA